MRRVLVALSAAVLFGATACGSDDEPQQPTNTLPTSVASSPSLPGASASTPVSSTVTTSAAVTEVDCGGATVTATVTTSGFTFTPADVALTVGQTVKFEVGDTHNVVSDEVKALAVDFGGTKCFTVGIPGEINYYCAPHKSQGMTGVLRVSR